MQAPAFRRVPSALLGLLLSLGAPIQMTWAAGPKAASDASQIKLAVEQTPGKLVVEQSAGRQSLALEAGSGRVLTLPGPAANVFVADPRVAEVRPASISSLFVFGVGPGRTTVAVMDSDGHAISQIEVTVRPNTFVAGEAEAAVAKLLANSRIRVTALARGLLLTGTVGSWPRGMSRPPTPSTTRCRSSRRCRSTCACGSSR
jgi:Flp pilus assembly secretin CpaC